MDKYYDDSTKMSNLSKETKDLLKECESCTDFPQGTADPQLHPL